MEMQNERDRQSWKGGALAEKGKSDGECGRRAGDHSPDRVAADFQKIAATQFAVGSFPADSKICRAR